MRRKNFFRVIAFAAIVTAAGWSFQQSQNETVLSDLTLANVEALAQYEDDYFPNGCLAESGSGCWCYRWYDGVKEATWH